MRRNGHSIRDIATTLSWGVGTISDELNRNKVAGTYDPEKAQAKANVRCTSAKFQGKKIVAYPDLQTFVEAELLNQQSPSAISGRLATGLENLPYASRDTIEQYVRSVHGRRIEYELKLLKQTRKGRSKRPAAEQLDNRKSIAERPSVIANRERVGDVEADFMCRARRAAESC